MNVLGQVLVVAGALLFAVGALGLLRLPDVYSRASSVTLVAEVGTGLILVGVLLLSPSVSDLVKVVVAILLQAVGCAVGGMMVVRSAYVTGSELTPRTARDELALDAERNGDS
jgi:multicomponent Na+:H+ antiporter subunit G